MLIAVDEAIWGADHLYSDLGRVRLFPGRSLTPADVADADALIIRSVTRVGPDLLADSKVRFVGSTVSGDDHLDLPWLASRGIEVATAAGCNTRTVAEYVLAALLILAEKHQFALQEKTIGIIGVGRIGGLLASWCEALGLRTLLCDPPRALRAATVRERRETPSAEQSPDRSSNASTAEFFPLDEVLRRSDIVTLHVPLTRQGPHATLGMINDDAISACKHGLFLINTARGQIVDEAALIAGITRAQLRAVIDVWQNEPNINRRLLDCAELATPHMAGHSAAARRRGAEMIHAALATYPNRDRERAGIPPIGGMDSQSSAARRPALPGKSFNWNRLAQAIHPICDLESFDRRLRAGQPFDQVRSLAASRLEFPEAPAITGLSAPEVALYSLLGLPARG